MLATAIGRKRAKTTFRMKGGTLRTSQAIQLGIHPRILYALRDAGKIEQIGRGLYRLASKPQLTSPDIIPIAMRIPRAVICLVSALAHHGLTTQIPHAVSIALPSHGQIPKIDGIPLSVYWYSDRSFNAGIVKTRIDGVPVNIYSPEKLWHCLSLRRSTESGK